MTNAPFASAPRPGLEDAPPIWIAPGSVEAEFCRRGVLGKVVRVSLVQGLVFGWGSVVAPGVEPGVVEPVDPFGGGH